MPDLTNKLRELRCPILGVVGDLDPVFMEMMKILSENAKVSLRIIHDCRHFVMMEEPDEFKIIANFLKTYNLK